MSRWKILLILLCSCKKYYFELKGEDAMNNANSILLNRFIFYDVSNVKLITETEDIEKGSCAYINSIGAMVVYINGYMSGESTVNICMWC